MPKKTCKVSADRFCYVCGQYIVGQKGKNITFAMQNAYMHYFGFSVSGTEKPWVPNVFCNACRIKLYRWSLGVKTYFPFSSPMLWREPQDHTTDCYFCLSNVVGITSKHVKSLKYPDVSSVTKPIPCLLHDRMPIFPGTSSSSVKSAQKPDVMAQNLVNLSNRSRNVMATRMCEVCLEKRELTFDLTSSTLLDKQKKLVMGKHLQCAVMVSES